MANRIILNPVSYHGKGAIREIPAIAKSKGFSHIFVCSDPDLVRFGVTGMVRASFAVYNTLDEVAAFVNATRRVATMLS